MRVPSEVICRKQLSAELVPIADRPVPANPVNQASFDLLAPGELRRYPAVGMGGQCASELLLV